MCIYTYAYICTYRYRCRHEYIYTYTHIHIYTYTHTYIHICIHTHTHTDTHRHKHTQIHTHSQRERETERERERERHTRTHTTRAPPLLNSACNFHFECCEQQKQNETTARRALRAVLHPHGTAFRCFWTARFQNQTKAVRMQARLLLVSAGKDFKSCPLHQKGDGDLSKSSRIGPI